MEQFIANGICKGMVYALVALGFGLIYTTSRVFHVAHGFVYTAGAYFLFGFCCLLNAPFTLSVAAALLITPLLSILIEILVYRPLISLKASSMVFLISSFGVYIVGSNLIAMFFGNESRILRSGAEETFQLGSVILTYIQLLQLISGFFIFLAYWLFLSISSLGRTIRAVADDPTLSAVLGIRVDAVRLLVFAIGSFLAASGSVLTALDVGITPHAGLIIVLDAAVACILGGLHRLLAPALGGILLGLMQSLVIWQTSSRWESSVTFVILIVFLLFRPQGIFGYAQRLEEQ